MGIDSRCRAGIAQVRWPVGGRHRCAAGPEAGRTLRCSCGRRAQLAELRCLAAQEALTVNDHLAACVTRFHQIEGIDRALEGKGCANGWKIQPTGREESCPTST